MSEPELTHHADNAGISVSGFSSVFGRLIVIGFVKNKLAGLGHAHFKCKSKCG